MSAGRQSRTDRLISHHVGAWATTSQDYVVLATQIFALSASEASRNQKAMSAFVFAGLPLLFSAVRALLIECNSRAWGAELNVVALERLAREPNELPLLREQYEIDARLASELGLLYEVRNEIVHPSHRPSGTADNTPDYLRSLKALGILVSTGDPKSDYTWTDQLQSHALFRFAFSRVEATVVKVLVHHQARDQYFDCPSLQTYQRYRYLDASA